MVNSRNQASWNESFLNCLGISSKNIHVFSLRCPHTVWKVRTGWRSGPSESRYMNALELFGGRKVTFFFALWKTPEFFFAIRPLCMLQSELGVGAKEHFPAVLHLMHCRIEPPPAAAALWLQRIMTLVNICSVRVYRGLHNDMLLCMCGRTWDIFAWEPPNTESALLPYVSAA